MEAETKLAGLQQDIGQLSTMSDTEVAMEEAQAEQLQQVGRGGPVHSLTQGCLHESGAIGACAGNLMHAPYQWAG